MEAERKRAAGWRLDARWVAMGVITLASALNFLDRQLLAALAPQLMSEFRLTAAQYGDVIFAFSICYAVSAPLAGLLIDRLGLRAGAALAVGAWSLAGLGTGWTRTLGQLTLARAALGTAEAGGVPSTGKAAAVWLKPGERALGSGLTQTGLSLGAVLAPLLGEFCARVWGWRSAFLAAGALGFVWIPIWWFASGRPALASGAGSADASSRAAGVGGATAGTILRDRRYWALLGANVLLMLVYSLWVNWTTVFFVNVMGLSQHAANTRLAWIPPVFASAGGLAGGWLALRWSRSMEIVRARLRVILVAAVALLATALVPMAGTPALAAACISLSFFACVFASVNIYSLPLDLFGAGAAGFAVSGLTGVYGLLQGGFASLVGRAVDAHGFAPVCVAVALCPLLAWALLRVALDREVRG
jgi:ACS family hexuronate transporter-like MFS transporter